MNAPCPDPSPTSRFEHLFGPLGLATDIGVEIYFPALKAPVVIVERVERISGAISVSCEVGQLVEWKHAISDWLIRRQPYLHGAFFYVTGSRGIGSRGTVHVRMDLPLSADRDSVAGAARIVAEATHNTVQALKRAGSLEGDEDL